MTSNRFLLEYFMKNFKKPIVLTAVVTGFGLVVWQGLKKMSRTSAKSAMVIATGATVVAPAYAISESSVQGFASAMNSAANNQNIGQISRLIDDEAVISLTRQGKTTTLDKNAYLQLLQKSWAGASNYRYNINISDIVVSGNQARAVVITTETWEKDGKKTTFRSTSRTTLSQSGSNAILLRAVSQITVE